MKAYEATSDPGYGALKIYEGTSDPGYGALNTYFSNQ
jgi:hypothetical protein